MISWIVASVIAVGHYWWIHKDNWQAYLDWEFASKYERADWLKAHPGMCADVMLPELPRPCE